MRKQTKIAALVSAAALLAIGASMTSFAAGWAETYAGSGEWQWLDNYGDPETNTWHTQSGYYLYLGDNGIVVKDEIIEYNGNYYYVDELGRRVASYWLSRPNTDGVMVGDYEPANLYYYFDSKGQAIRGKVSSAIKKSNSTTETSKFVFDEEGRMMSGWVDFTDGNTYYCGGEDEGYMTVGWAELELRETDDTNPYEGDTAWYYFDSGKMLKNTRKYLSSDNNGGKKYYFAFDSDGTLEESTFSDIGLASTSYANYKLYYTDGGYAASGWVEADYDGSGSAHSSTWFYFESNGLAYNYDGKDALATASASNANVTSSSVQIGKWNGSTFVPVTDTASEYAARVIDGKTYLFNASGEYLTGVFEITGTVYRKGSSQSIGNGIYYFDEVSGSPKGAMETKKDSWTTDDDITFNYQFTNTGKAAESQIYNGTLYDANGCRVDAEDTTWRVVDAYGYASDKAPSLTANANIKNSEGKYLFQAGDKIVVNASGRVKESGTVIIDGMKYYIKSVAAGTKYDGNATKGADANKDNKLDAAVTAETYVIVHQHFAD